MDVSVIIVNWNSREHLRKCLASIVAGVRTIRYEIVVIDSGSFDGCAEMMGEHFPQVRFIQSAENLGFSKANNQASASATGDCLLFLNPDTEIVGSAIDVTELKLGRLALSSLSQRLMQAQEHERAWVARELQDDLCQRMIVLTAQLHGLSESTIGDDKQMRSRVEELSGQFGEVATEIFAISNQLHSSNLARLGLPAATSIFCKELSTQHDVEFHLDDEGMPTEVPNDVALALFRVMQEAVRNAVRHSGARSVTVALRGRPGEIELEVADIGVGFDPDAVSTRQGLGLIGMRERLRLVDGECAIDARPGSGTRIRARVPLRQDPAALRTESSALWRVRDHGYHIHRS